MGNTNERHGPYAGRFIGGSGYPFETYRNMTTLLPLAEPEEFMKIENVRRAKAHTRYKLADGSPVPGVSTILALRAKPALLPWGNKLGLAGIEVKAYVDGLAVIGDCGHELCTSHVKNEDPKLSEYTRDEIDRAENCYLSFLEWEKRHSLKPYAVERQMVSETYGYGGTPDFLGEIDGVVEVMDLKTGKRIFPEAFLQVAAYAQLAEENGFPPVERVRILQIGRDESEGFSEKVMAHYFREWNIFYHLLQVYKLEHNTDGITRRGSRN